MCLLWGQGRAKHLSIGHMRAAEGCTNTLTYMPWFTLWETRKDLDIMTHHLPTTCIFGNIFDLPSVLQNYGALGWWPNSLTYITCPMTLQTLWVHTGPKSDIDSYMATNSRGGGLEGCVGQQATPNSQHKSHKYFWTTQSTSNFNNNYLYFNGFLQWGSKVGTLPPCWDLLRQVGLGIPCELALRASPHMTLHYPPTLRRPNLVTYLNWDLYLSGLWLCVNRIIDIKII